MELDVICTDCNDFSLSAEKLDQMKPAEMGLDFDIAFIILILDEMVIALHPAERKRVLSFNNLHSFVMQAQSYFECCFSLSCHIH